MICKRAWISLTLLAAQKTFLIKRGRSKCGVVEWELWHMRGEPFSLSLEQYCCSEMETTEGPLLWYGGACTGLSWLSPRLQERRDASPNDTPGQAEGNLSKTQPNSVWLSFCMYLWGILLPPEKQFSLKKTRALNLRDISWDTWNSILNGDIAMSVGAGVSSMTVTAALCLPSIRAKLEGKFTSGFALTSLGVGLTWLFGVWNEKLDLRVAEVLEDGFENNPVFLFVALLPASPT